MHVGGDEPWALDVQSALEDMDVTQSRVVRMVYFERQTLRQVADRLSLSLPDVARSLATGMQTLAARLAGAGAPHAGKD